MQFKRIFILVLLVVATTFLVLKYTGDSETKENEKATTKVEKKEVEKPKLPVTMFISELTAAREGVNGKPTFPLIIGTKVTIIADRDPWVYISVEDKKGWIEKKALSESLVEDKNIIETKRVLKDVVKEIKAKDKEGNEVITEKTVKEYVNEDIDIRDLHNLGNVQFKGIEKKSYDSNPKIDAKAIYISLYGLKHLETNVNNYIDLAKKSNINAFVIDVKDDSGWTLFPSKVAQEYLGKYYKRPRYNEEQIKKLMKKLRDNNIYTIARISTFKDTAYADNHPKDSIWDKRYNRQYQSRDKVKWTSPYDRNNWYYNVELSKEAADLGFNEILYDYVRFPDRVRTIEREGKLDYRNDYAETKPEAIQRFLKYAHDEMSKKEVYTAASIFGQIGVSKTDESLGQHWETISVVADFVNPMTYPSHFAYGAFGYKYPDAHPYGLMKKYAKRVNERDSKLENPAIVVMWIQGFTAPWVKGHIPYNAKEVRDQIRALEEEGLHGYLVWNAASRYKWEAFKDSVSK